ncbi:MAG: hypothetical protein AAGB24_16350 [Bacteroidota bacterium]
MVKKLISTDIKGDSGKLGKWNATVFYVHRKKCWLLTNGPTKYNVILTDIKTSDLTDIDSIFKESFYGQLVYDGILTDFGRLDHTIGKLEFLPTDDDRKTTGFQNHRLQELDWWKYEFDSLENMPMRDLANRMNDAPIKIGKGYKMSAYTDSIAEMKKLLKE